MAIQNLYFDEGYQSFLVLHAKIDQEEDKEGTNDAKFRNKVVVYSRPRIEPNTGGDLIGQTMEVFDLHELDGVFCINDKLIMLRRGTAE